MLTVLRLEQCRSCRHQGSVTAGTGFHGTQVPLRVWFLGIFFLARHKKGISALQFQRDTGVGSYQTAWTLLHKLRSGFVADPTRRLQGAVAVERNTRTAGAVPLAVIPHSTTAVLTPFAHASVQPEESTVFTDASGSHAPLRRLGIDHRPRKGGRGHQSVHLLPWAHTVFGNLKTWLRGTFHGIGPKHRERYLDEFVFRFDRRWRETELFIGVLHRALDAVPCP